MSDFVAGQAPSAAQLNDIQVRLAALEDPPGVCVYASGDSAIPDITDTAINFDSERYDKGGWFAAIDDKITVPSSGIYVFTATVVWESNATGTRVARITADGMTIGTDRKTAISGAGTPLTVVTAPVPLNAGVELQLIVRQSSTGALNVLGAGTDSGSSILSAEYVRPL